MWTRAELKMRGKQAFQRNYWSSVAVALVMAIVTGAFSASRSNNSNRRSGYGGYGGASDWSWSIGIILGILAVSFLAVAVLTLLEIFIGNALMVGGYRFFVLNQTEAPTAGTLGYVFKSGSFGNVILIMFLKDLFTFLWSLLFLIPGIIKHYEYLMIPYILAENPGMGREEAFAISKKMMMGQKWDVFVLDLSFIGWRILEGITFGIVGVFYVEPYVQATIAELYSVNRAAAYQNGYIR